MISLIIFRELSRENRTKLCSLRPRSPLRNTNSCMNGPPSCNSCNRSHNMFLLSVFALFSFFNSPPTSSWSSSSSNHGSHTGTVLTAAHPPLAYAPDIVSQFVAPQLTSAPAGWDWKEYVQLFHLVVSLLVLASFICSWLGLNFGREIGKVVGKRPSLRQSITTTTKRRQNTPTSWAKIGEESVLRGWSFIIF
jgi:hypothetical protein